MLDPQQPLPETSTDQHGAVHAEVELVADEARQVVFRRHSQLANYRIHRGNSLQVELVGTDFLPKGCPVEIALKTAGSPQTSKLAAVVRKVQMSDARPGYSITLQLRGKPPQEIAELLDSAAPASAMPSGLADLMAAGNACHPAWGARMIADGRLSHQDWESAVARSSQENGTVESTLVQMGLADCGEVAAYTGLHLGVPFLNLGAYRIALENRERLPEALAKRQCVFPLFVADGVVTLGMKDPSDLALIDQVRLRVNSQAEPCLCEAEELESLIEEAYRPKPRSGLSVPKDNSAPRAGLAATGAQGNQSIAQRVNDLLEESIRDGASDVHIEPETDHLRIRIRVDGILHQKASLPVDRHAAIVSRIKVMAKLDISETRRPQDGQFSCAVSGNSVDVRVSTIPTVHGENVVLRLLLSESQALDLDDIGMSSGDLDALRRALAQPNGMVLVAGPTGSGKTTTLYASLAELATIERNVVTIEDPVEIRLPLLRQTQVHPKADVTFATGLRSILRQDPDVVMVGEIRDMETAEVAVQASLTGHLVLSTIHTNTAAGAILRLGELGVAPYLLTSALRVVVSQRLVRRVCEACKEPAAIDQELAARMGLGDDLDGAFYAGRGCTQCMSTGFKGRVGIYEVLEVSPSICDALTSGSGREAIERQAQSSIREGILSDGLAKARLGITTLEEVARLVGLPSPRKS